jgi:putative colanic acid biosynthesis glycosyltransferase
MKVLLIDVNCKHSSTGKIVYDLYRELNKQGHTASIAYGRGSQINEPNILKYGYDLETMFHAAMTRITGLTGYFSWLSTRRLLHHLKLFQPDVVHLHDLHGYHLNIGTIVKYLKTNKIKTIWTFHSEFMYTGKCAHSKSCVKFEIECHNCPLLKEYPKSLGLDFSRFMHRSKKRWFSDFDSLTIVSTSEWLERKLNRSFLKSMPRRLITNGIDTSIFRLYEVDENPMKDYGNKFIVLSVIAKLDDPNKGFHIIQRLAEEAQGSDLIFVVIGSKGKITNLPSNILNIPRTENQIELAKFYAFSDLYLMVSEFETYPTVTLEASAASLPILAFDAGGTKETIIGVHGKVLPYDSPDTLDEIYNFKTIIQSKNYKKVRNPQLDIIDKSKMIDSYISVYQGASL